jgi:hypothetical protein
MKKGLSSLLDGLVEEARKRNVGIEKLEEDLSAVSSQYMQDKHTKL